MNPPTIARLALATLLAMGAAQAALAQSTDQPSPPPGGRTPPQAAIDACKGKAEGAPVSFVGRQGNTVQGLCHNLNGTLVAAPERGQGGGRRIPPEAIAACSGKTAGTAVSFQDREGSTRNGSCTDINGTLAAVTPELAQRMQQRREGK